MASEGEVEVVNYFPDIFTNQEETPEGGEVAKLTAPIPSWISGSYVRNGPGKFDLGEITVNHFLDGYSMLTKFDIRDGKVVYTKKYLQSDSYKKAIEAKRPILAEFCTDGVAQGFFRQMFSVFSSAGLSDNNQLNLFSLEGHPVAISECCLAHTFDKETLDIGPLYDFHKLFGFMMMTAHPMRDSNGDVYNAGQNFSTGMRYQIVKIPNLGTGNFTEALKKGKIIASIYPSWGAYFSFAMTEKYIVVIEQPMFVNVMKLTDAKLKAKSVREAMEWRPQEKNRFHIVDKTTGEVYKTKFYADKSFFFFHIANSFEDGDHIVIDVNAYPNADVLDIMFMKPLRDRKMEGADTCQITRFVLPIKKNIKDIPKDVNSSSLTYTTASAIRNGDIVTLTPEELGLPGFEGARVNPFKTFKRHRYIFGSGTCCFGNYANSLCRLDTTTKKAIVWREADYFFLGEPEFIPSPNAKDEEDGVILSATSDGRKDGKDFLIFIDAKTMKEISRAVVDHKIPQCVHGQFFADKTMKDCFPPNHPLF